MKLIMSGGFRASDGDVLSFTEALGQIIAFEGFPLYYKIPWSVFTGFVERAAALTVPSGNELGYRFYLGSKNSQTNLNIVVMPVYGPLTAPDAYRSHEDEKEESFVTSFFSLVISGDKIGIEEITENAAAFIYNKIDSEHFVQYHSQLAFSAFINNLEEEVTPSELMINFGVSDGLTGLIFFILDDKGNPMTSSNGRIPEPKIGIAFDQGDLIPPPPSSGLEDSYFV